MMELRWGDGVIGGKVLQNTEVMMCVDTVDTLRFEDLDKDEFLDMHIVYLDHAVVSESNADDQFSYTYYWYDPPSYWLWDNSKICSVACLNPFTCLVTNRKIKYNQMYQMHLIMEDRE